LPRCGEHLGSRINDPRVIPPADARLIGCAGLRCPARRICPADARPICCAGLRCPARRICPADARLIGCAGLGCTARLIGCAGLGCTARLIGCAGLRYPAGLIRPLSLQRATPVQSKRHAQGCHREREGFEGFFERHCSLLSLNRHSPDSLHSDGTEKRLSSSPGSYGCQPRTRHGCAYFHATRSDLEPWGKPVAFYSDKHGVRKNRSTLAIHSPGRI